LNELAKLVYNELANFHRVCCYPGKNHYVKLEVKMRTWQY